MDIKGKVKVFKNKYGYSVSEAVKDRNGNYIPNFTKARFPKSMAILPEDKEVIEIVNGFSSPYLDKDNKTIQSYMILEWKSLGTAKQTEKKEEDPYKVFADEIEENNLPF